MILKYLIILLVLLPIKVLAESALRAVKLCQPLRVPSTGYERWKELQLNFDAREMLEG